MHAWEKEIAMSHRHPGEIDVTNLPFNPMHPGGVRYPVEARQTKWVVHEEEGDIGALERKPSVALGYGNYFSNSDKAQDTGESDFHRPSNDTHQPFSNSAPSAPSGVYDEQSERNSEFQQTATI